MQSSGAVRWKYETGLGVSVVTGGIGRCGGRSEAKTGICMLLEVEHGKTAVESARGGSADGAGGVRRFDHLYPVVGIAGAGPGHGKVLWRAGLGTGVQNAPVIAGKTMYLTSDDGDVYALE